MVQAAACHEPEDLKSPETNRWVLRNFVAIRRYNGTGLIQIEGRKKAAKKEGRNDGSEGGREGGGRK